MNPTKHRSDYKYIILPLVLSGIIALIFGAWSLCVAVPLLIYSLWYIRQTQRVYDWLQKGAQRSNAPALHGTADRIVSLICDQHREQDAQQSYLTELLNRFDAATSAMPDALLIIDSNGVIEWCNAASAPLLGIDSQRDVGKPVENIVRDPLVSGYLNKGDYTHPLQFTVRAEQGNDGVLRVVPYGNRKRLLSVQDHSDMLRLQQVRHAFVSNASHEMRTPLTVIIGYLEALSTRTESDATLQRAVNGALEQAHRMQRLVEDLLSLTRLESAPLELGELDVVRIGTLVRETVELLKASPGNEGLPIHLSLSDDDRVLGNYSELRSAVGNVIENAVKHTPKEAAIEIELNHEDQWVVLRVIDHGEGIDRQHIHRLTERFYRVDKGRSRDQGGTGLGLSIVKHVMNRHGGSLVIDSKIGLGSTFELRFKAA